MAHVVNGLKIDFKSEASLQEVGFFEIQNLADVANLPNHT